MAIHIKTTLTKIQLSVKTDRNLEEWVVDLLVNSAQCPVLDPISTVESEEEWEAVAQVKGTDQETSTTRKIAKEHKEVQDRLAAE